QPGLHLARRHPDATRLEQVVAAAQAGEDAVSGADVGVAGAEPVADEHGAARVGAAPVPQRDRLTSDVEGSGLADRYERPGGITQLDVVTGNRPAGRAGTDVVGVVGQEDVQRLRRAD